MMRRNIALIGGLLKNQVKFRQSQMVFKNRFAFSSEENDPPKGFEKFKRKAKSDSNPGSISQQNSEKNQQQTITNEEKKSSTDKDEQINQEEQVDKKNDEQVKEQPQKKKYTFTYDPKLFGLNKKDDPKQKNKEHDDHQETQQNNKEDFSGQINFNDPKFRKYMAGIVGVGGILLVMFLFDESQVISYTEFIKMYLEKDAVRKIIIQREGSGQKVIALIYVNDMQVHKKLVLGNVDHFLENLERAQIEKGKQPDQFIPVEFQYSVDQNKILDRLINLIYLGVSVTIAYLLIKSIRSTMGQVGKGGSGDVFGFGKSNVKQFGFEQTVKVKFKDVAGLDEAKNEIKEFVDFLKRPRKYKDLGAKIPRGALLAGPPGTGKTMLAKACAGEAGVPFFYVSGSDFVEMFVGVGASRVRDLFKQAKTKSPGIIFIDEIDAVGRKRESRVGGNDERDNTLNQLLVEMDGFGTDHNIIVLAATNRKELLDPALTRPGRFDRTIDINLPDIEGRKQIFMVHLQPLKLDQAKTTEEYARRLATLTPGFSGAEIANLCNEGAILAARHNKLAITSQDFEMAAERVMAGLEKKSIISPEERKVIAYHESGHAVVSWFLEGGAPLLKLTIIPRTKGSLGYAQYLPNESSLESREELYDRICCILGGRCSEEIFFNRITTGAYDDLKKAYDTAHAIVTKFGMSPSIGYVGYQESEFQKPYSDKTNSKIDDEIMSVINECTQRTKLLIIKHKDDIERLASTLLEKETLDLQKLVDILGERPFPPKSNYKAFLDLKRLEKEEEKAEENSKESSEPEESKEKIQKEQSS